MINQTSLKHAFGRIWDAATYDKSVIFGELIIILPWVVLYGMDFFTASSQYNVGRALGLIVITVVLMAVGICILGLRVLVFVFSKGNSNLG